MDMKHKNYVNFLAGNPLNRLSWKRHDPIFIRDLIQSQHCRWIIFRKGQPLMKTATDGRNKGLVYVPSQKLQAYLENGNPFESTEAKALESEAVADALQCARTKEPRIVFLGVHLPKDTNPNAVKDMVANGKVRDHVTYFSMDIGEKDTDATSDDAGSPFGRSGEDEVAFVEPRGAMMSLSPFEAGIFAEARSVVDWNARNKFCPACGSPNYSIWSGWKLACSTQLPSSEMYKRIDCPSSKGLQNYVHPRSDPVVIVAVISPKGDKILLGRNKRFPAGMYSCLAGFIEPGESIEEGVRREVVEESGIAIDNVQYHSSQPWPYPANIMLGCYAVAESESIELLDGELEDARFFTKEEVRQVLSHPKGAMIRSAEYKKFDDEAVANSALAPPDKPGTGHHTQKSEVEDKLPFRTPPVSAIAGVLISEWAYDRAPSDKSSL